MTETKMHPQEIAKALIHLGKLYCETDGSLPVLAKGSEEWRIWREWRRMHGLSVAFMDKQDQYTVPCFLPPDDLQRVMGAARPLPKARRQLPRD